MKRILIADSSKASLVMTSEVFKDNYPGIQVLVAKSSQEALVLAKSHNDIDAFIIDYDLPDLNGAKTALLLKKSYKTPILITTFDNVEAITSIESLLSKYDDCKSWLKKPVHPEVVIAVAQRYCDGKIRTQKRITCQLPVLAMLELPIKKIKSTSKTKTVKKEPIISDAQELFFQGTIQDCSLSGIRLKPNKEINNNKLEWAKLLESIETIANGHEVTVKIPAFIDIEIGKLSQFEQEGLKKNEKTSKSPSSKSKTVKKLSITKETNEKDTQELNGKIIWTSADSGEWCMGIEFEDQNLSKKLFEAVVSFHGRHHKSFQSQNIMKIGK